MSAVAPAADLPRRLRVAVKAADPATAKRLAALVAAAGHEVVAAADAADAVLTDGSAEPPPGAQSVALGAGEGDFAGMLPSEAGAGSGRCRAARRRRGPDRAGPAVAEIAVRAVARRCIAGC